MLETVDVGTQDLNFYERSAGAEAVAQLRELAAPLKGVRILHVNATPYGGGVAEILRSEIPLLRDLGLLADWKLITGDQTFFSVTKAIHNGIQGAARELTPTEQETYLTYSTRNAQLLEEEYNLVVVHDPQPLALLKLHGKGTARWVWRCHIDTSEPNLQVRDFLRSYLEDYDAAVFTLGSVAPPDVPVERIEVIPPVIDPESPKNFELRLPARDPRDRARAHRRRPLPRSRLLRAGHHDNPLRHGRPERHEPLPPGDGRPEAHRSGVSGAGPRPDPDLRAGGFDLQGRGLFQRAPAGPARDP
jgi:hypothetical protein